METETIIGDNYLYGYNLCGLEQSIEKDEFLHFIDLSERAKQSSLISGKDKQRFIFNLENEFKISEDDIYALANLEDGIFTKIKEGAKKIIKKIIDFIKKILFFWKKNPIDDKKVKSLTVDDIKNKILKDKKFAIKADSFSSLNIGYETISETADVINKYIGGDLKAKGHDIYKQLLDINKEEVLDSVNQYLPKEKKFMFFKKTIDVDYEILPLNLSITDAKEIEDELQYSVNVIGTLILRDKQGNIIGFHKTKVGAKGSFNKNDVDKLAKIEFDRIKNIKTTQKLLGNLIKDIELIDKEINKISEKPEDSKVGNSLKKLDYEVDSSFIIKQLSSVSKQLVSIASECSSDLKEAAKMLS